jgi:esterase/lipase
MGTIWEIPDGAHQAIFMKVIKEKITFLSENQKIRGTLWKPAEIKNKVPGVIFFHGMTSSEKGYIPIAERLSKLGICAMTLSIRGHGESDGDFSKLTVKNAICDGLNAYDFLVKHSFVDNNKIGLCGSSVGGVIVSMVAKKRKVKSLILKAPAAYTKKMMNMLYPQTMLREARMFKEIQNISDAPPIKAISHFKGSLLAIISEKDNIIPIEIPKAYLSTAKKASSRREVIIKDADHALTKKKWKQKFINEMASWFKATLLNI